MAETPPISPLGYFTPSPRQWKFPEDDVARQWRYRRVAYRLGLGGLFVLIAFYFGPNLINFHKLTRLSPGDFVVITQQQCVPIVRAVKEFQRDTGCLPVELKDLAPRYLPEAPGGWAEIEAAKLSCYTMWGHMVYYDFTAGREGWSVRGPIANGAIPAPQVTIGPRATSQPLGPNFPRSR